MGKIKKRDVNKGARVSVVPETPDYNGQTPVFSFQFLQQPYCISNCDRDQKAHLVDALHRRCQLTWQDFMNAGRRQMGTEKIDKNAINAPIPRQFEQEEFFLAFRAIHEARAVGIRVKRTFYIVWVDHDFTLYDH